MQIIDLADVQRLLGEGAQVVDVLPPAEYAAEHLPGAISIPVEELDATTASACPGCSVGLHSTDELLNAANMRAGHGSFEYQRPGA